MPRFRQPAQPRSPGRAGTPLPAAARAAAAPSPARRRVLLVGLGLLALAAVATWGFQRWRDSQRLAPLARAVPVRPTQPAPVAGLRARLDAAEARLRRREDVAAAFAELASLYHANGYLPEAAACYQALLGAQPAEPRWAHALATLYAGYGQLEPAALLWTQALARQPDYVPARLRLGDALFKLNRDAEAAAAYAAALGTDADNPYALTGLARLDVRAGRLPAARERLERAAQKSNFAIGADLLADVCDKLGDSTRSADLRGRAKSSGAYFDPPDPWIDAIYFDCFDVFRVCVAAGVAGHGGDVARSRRLLDHALTLAPDDGQVLLQYGLLAIRQQDFALARRHLEHATRVAPKLSDVWAQLIVACNGQGDAAGAESALGNGLMHCPQSPSLHLELARRLAARGQSEAAIREFRTSHQLRPEEAGALFELAGLLFSLDRTDAGLAEVRRALAIEPEHPVGLTTLALHAIGTGDAAGARQWLRRAREQPRVPREQLQELMAHYQAEFGHAP